MWPRFMQFLNQLRLLKPYPILVENERRLRQSAALLLHLYSLRPEERAKMPELNVYLHECFIHNYASVYRNLSELEHFKQAVNRLGKAVPIGQRKVEFVYAHQRFFNRLSSTYNLPSSDALNRDIRV